MDSIQCNGCLLPAQNMQRILLGKVEGGEMGEKQPSEDKCMRQSDEWPWHVADAEPSEITQSWEDQEGFVETWHSSRTNRSPRLQVIHRITLVEHWLWAGHLVLCLNDLVTLMTA